MYSGEVYISAENISSVSASIVSKSPSTAIVQLLTHNDVSHYTVNVRGIGTRTVVRFIVRNACGTYSRDYTFVGNGPCNTIVD